jgi:hypothetical protein
MIKHGTAKNNTKHTCSLLLQLISRSEYKYESELPSIRSDQNDNKWKKEKLFIRKKQQQQRCTQHFRGATTPSPLLT